jgi:hypothetical protein
MKLQPLIAFDDAQRLFTQLLLAEVQSSEIRRNAAAVRD